MIHILGERVLVELDEITKKKGVIHLPDSALSETKSVKGTVLIAGDKCTLIKKGDRVIAPRESYYKMILNEVGYSVTYENDILAILTGEHD